MNPITPTDNKLMFVSENFAQDAASNPPESNPPEPAQNKPVLESRNLPAETSVQEAKTASITRETPSHNLLSAAVSEMNEFVQSIQRELHFTIDEDSGRTVVKVIDKSTNEVIRQVPPEDLLAMLKEFSRPAQPGLIFKNSA